MSVKTISRSAGRSATASAAYRAGVEITDERTGEVHDYTRKRGVEHAALVLPADAPAWAADRAALWNAAEASEKRKNSVVAREFEIALPEELSPAERQRLAMDFARELVERHGFAADVTLHEPNRKGDERNYHAHILCSTRRLIPDGFGKKTRELDEQKSGEVERWRERFSELQNERLRENGIDARVDHRSLEAQGIEREPTRHLGPAATGYERRTGEPSRRRLDIEQEIAERLARAKELGELERQAQQINRSILDLSGNIKAARAERERQKRAPSKLVHPREFLAALPENQREAVGKEAKRRWDEFVAKEFAAVRAKALRIGRKGEKNLEWAEQRILDHEKARPQEPSIFGAMFGGQSRYERDYKKWAREDAALERRYSKAKGRLEIAREYSKEPIAWYSSKGLDLAKHRAAQKEPKIYGLAKEFERIEREQESERIKRSIEEQQRKRELERGRDRGRSR